MRHPLRLVLPVVAALLFTSLDHGLPERYVPDDHAVRCALGIARDLSDPDLPALQALVPPSGRYTTYPYLLPYLDLVAVGVVYVGGRLAGAWAGAGEFAEGLFDDPTPAWLAARVVTALLSLLLPLATYRAARELRRTRGEAALAALLAGSSLLFVQYAHTERPWAPLAAFGAASLALSLRLRRRGRARDGALAALAAAAAACCHPAGALFLLLPLVAARVFRLRAPAVLAGLLVGALLIACVGYPYLLVYRADAGSGAIAGQLGAETAVDVGGQAFDLSAFHARQLLPVLRGWFGGDPVLLLCGALGLAWLARRVTPGARALLLPFPIGVVALFLVYDGTHVRYLMPVTPFLALGAAACLARLAQRGGARAALAVLLLALPVVQCARLVQLLGRTDTRTLAAAQLPALLPPDARVALDGYAPPLRADAASLTAIEPLVGLSRSERRWLDFARAGVPEPPQARFLVPVIRFWKYDSYYPTDYLHEDKNLALGEWMDRWGIDFYVQVDRVPDEERRRPVTDLMAQRFTLAWEISPEGRSPPREGALPTDLGFALTQLWRAERPGPWIRLWRRTDGGP